MLHIVYIYVVNRNDSTNFTGFISNSQIEIQKQFGLLAIYAIYFRILFKYGIGCLYREFNKQVQNYEMFL